MNIRNVCAFVSCILLLYACDSGYDNFKNVPGSVMGWKPVYYDDSKDIRKLIVSGPPRSLHKPGKIYLYKQYLFIGEGTEGVHVLDNTDPAVPLPLAFISIPYNHDIAVRDTVLYADTYVGLVAIGISRLPAIQVLSVIPNAFRVPQLPLNNDTFFFDDGWNNNRIYFECPDYSKGKVVAWERAELIKPKCYHELN